jgi:arylsulfatase A-like enzyme
LDCKNKSGSDDGCDAFGHGWSAHGVSAGKKKPNILVIMTDDVGVWNISAYHRGMMGGRTPTIDRIANEGALFTDYYAQQSCTAGRAAFITGQHPFAPVFWTVGLPGATLGLQKEDPTIADLLKPLGYATAQVGKNHLGDSNFCPPSTASMNFTETSITSTPRKSRKTRTTPRIPHFTRSSVPAECSVA